MEKAALETYRKVCSFLAPNIAGKIERPQQDPGILRKGDHDRIRLRILPVRSEMKPVHFWHRRACYYEILIGHCRTSPRLCLGAVQFFRYANQGRCGGNKYTSDLIRIFEKLESKCSATNGFTFTTASLDGKFHFQRYYYAKDFKGVLYPCDAAAKDLAWLITETLLTFQALP